jgi:hypothetical protein
LPAPPPAPPKRSVAPVPAAVPEPAVETSHIYERVAEKSFVPEKAIEFSAPPAAPAPNDNLLAALTSSPPRRSTPPLPTPAYAPPVAAPPVAAPLPMPTPPPMAAPFAMGAPIETHAPAIADVGPQPLQAPFTAPSTPRVSSPVGAEALHAPRRSEVPNFGEALSTRTRLLGLVLPLWVPIVSMLGLIAAGLTVAALVTGPRADSAAPSAPSAAQTAAPLSTASVPVAPPAAPAARVETATKASGGELAVDVLALAETAAQKEMQTAKEFRERMKRDPAVLKDKSALLELRKLTQDPDTARETLGGIAELPGPLGADLLYEIWTGTPNRTDATELARALVHAPDVRAKASPALSVALELRRAETCEQNQALLARAVSEGDRRSFSLLAKLKRKQGCGPNKRQDCYACLREGTELDDAIKAVKTKRAPNPFSP